MHRIGAVSYTHLDVYKRQVCINVFLKPCFTCRALNKTDNKFVQRSCFAAAFNKHGACTVSYTHLDVYKRQVWG